MPYDPNDVKLERELNRFAHKIERVRAYRIIRYTIALVCSMAIVVATSVLAAIVMPQYQKNRVREYYVKEVYIPTRDGSQLYTKIFTPSKSSKSSFPILLIRTPYGTPAHDETTGTFVCNDTLQYLEEDEDVKGRFNSSGAFAMSRIWHESYHAYDTIDWLVQNVENNNGKVGMLGTSYDALLTLLALKDKHPSLAAVAPFASPVDYFLYDDIGHNGAFRFAPSFDYITLMETNSGYTPWKHRKADLYLSYLEDLPTIADAQDALVTYLHALPTWTKIIEHPIYDEFWRNMSLVSFLQSVALDIPMLCATGWFDAEDFWGGIELWNIFKPKGADIYLAIGPWSHGQWFDIHNQADNGQYLGDLDFGSPTADYFRANILRPFFRRYLWSDTTVSLPRVSVFQTGINLWKTLESWPQPKDRLWELTLFMHKNNRLASTPATTMETSCYISDPHRPVPYMNRPINNWWIDPKSSALWVIADQRPFQYRPDVLFWQSDPLGDEVHLSGQVTVNLFASTNSTDADWIIKLIDVFPDDGVPEALRGYQMLLAYDTFRAKYFMLDSQNTTARFSSPQPVPPGVLVEYTFKLPHRNHAFLRGHRIMVQLQSTMFPLVERNPQKFMNTTEARVADFVIAEHCVAHSPLYLSRLSFPTLKDV